MFKASDDETRESLDRNSQLNVAGKTKNPKVPDERKESAYGSIASG